MNGSASSPIVAPIIGDYFELAMDFDKLTVEHCVRAANRVPHELVRLARVHPPTVWMENPPSSVLALIVDDVSLFKIFKQMCYSFFHGEHRSAFPFLACPF